MSLKPRVRSRAIAGIAMALGMTAGAAPTVSATEAAEDGRALIREGDIRTCDRFGGGILIGLGDGEPVENMPLRYQGGQPGVDAYVAIARTPSDIVVTAIVVKAGARHHVYVPGKLGLPGMAPWEDLRAPLDDQGQLPRIDHWFACGEEAPMPSPVPSGPTENAPADEEHEGPVAAEISAEIALPATSGSPPPTREEERPSKTVSAAPAVDTDDLASTGFGEGWLAGLGAALLVVGSGLLAVSRLRRGRTGG